MKYWPVGIWGPHLVVVPTSVMLNWEMEFKKWCPSFKILTYYGSQKDRRLKRTGWTKPNAFHVCITSYKLVIQDHQAFRRKRWRYFILDEAQNIKNFKSQRWQLLLNFQSQRYTHIHLSLFHRFFFFQTTERVTIQLMITKFIQIEL